MNTKKVDYLIIVLFLLSAFSLKAERGSQYARLSLKNYIKAFYPEGKNVEALTSSNTEHMPEVIPGPNNSFFINDPKVAEIKIIIKDVNKNIFSIDDHPIQIHLDNQDLNLANIKNALITKNTYESFVIHLTATSELNKYHSQAQLINSVVSTFFSSIHNLQLTQHKSSDKNQASIKAAH